MAALCSLSIHLRNSGSRKTLEQKFIFQIGTLNPHSINELFSKNIFFCRIHASTKVQLYLSTKNHTKPKIALNALISG